MYKSNFKIKFPFPMHNNYFFLVYRFRFIVWLRLLLGHRIDYVTGVTWLPPWPDRTTARGGGDELPEYGQSVRQPETHLADARHVWRHVPCWPERNPRTRSEGDPRNQKLVSVNLRHQDFGILRQKSVKIGKYRKWLETLWMLSGKCRMASANGNACDVFRKASEVSFFDLNIY